MMLLTAQWQAFNMFQSELLNLNPLSLIILLIAGGGVIYVVKIFTAAQTAREKELLTAQAIREKEMWAGVAATQQWQREITERWLSSIETQSRDDNESVRYLANNIAAHTRQMEQLTAAINRNIESGTNLHGAVSLMTEYLQRSNGGSQKHEAKR